MADSPPSGFDTELERRIALLEHAEQQGGDFDAVAWWVLVLFGIVVPCIALYLGRL